MSQHGCPERLSNRSKGFQEEGGSQPTMELLVETLTGTAFEMTVSPSDTIFAIKSKIFRVEGIPVAQQHLVYNLQELEDGRSLRELSIGSGARLRLVLGMRGGPVSTRRLPPPAPHHAEPWPDIERLLDSTRDELELGAGAGAGAGGCKVTVLVFRDGERVNMLRVRENTDGTYSPIDTNKYSSSVCPAAAEGGAAESGAGALRENAVTMGKMLELRRRMESLTLQRAACDTSAAGDKVEIQKTRSEEALPTHAPPPEPYSPYTDDDCFHDNYTRYSYDCGFGSRYTLLPPIGARDAPETDARHPALQRRQSRREGEEAAILEECVGGAEDCVRAPDARPARTHHDYGELVGVGGCSWRGHSASALQLRAAAPAAPRPHLDAPFSSSTSDLENLKRNSRLLPGLSRARPREHLHLSDEGLHLRREQPPHPAATEHPLYLRRECPAGGAEERLYNRRELAPAAAAAAPEDALYLRTDNSQPSAADDRLYNRRELAAGHEHRLYNRRDTTSQVSKDEDRLYNRREITSLVNEDNLYRREITQPQDMYLRQNTDDRLYMSTDMNQNNDSIFRDSTQNIAIEDRLYMHTEQNLSTDDSLYMNRDQILQNLNDDHPYAQRNLKTQSMGYEDRLYMRKELTQSINGEDRLYNRGGKVQEKVEQKGQRDGENVVEMYRGCEVPQPVEATVEVKEKKIRVRCGWCKKRLSVATVHACRCGGAWCARHRYAEVHGCAWDYKAQPRAPPPALTPPKLPKI